MNNYFRHQIFLSRQIFFRFEETVMCDLAPLALVSVGQCLITGLFG